MARAPRIGQDEFRIKLDAGAEMQVLDVRNPVSYAASAEKIPGAIRIPVDELEGRLDELDPAREVVAYCT